MTLPSRRTEKPTTVRYRVLGLTLALVGVAYLDRVCIAGAAPVIERDLGLDDVQLGYVFSAFTLSYALFEIPSGWFADRFGPRKALTRIVLWWSAMTAATGLTVGFGSLLSARLFFGMGEAGAFPAIARVYARWLPAEQRGRAFGLAVMTGALSGAATQPLVVSLLSRIGWRYTFAIFGCVGLVWAAAWWWYFRDDPLLHPRVNDAERRSLAREDGSGASHAKVPWRVLFRSRTLIALSVMYAGTIYGWYFYLTWLPTYLLRARGFNLKQAGMLGALPLLSIAAGVFFGGWLSDHLPRYVGPRTSRRIEGMVGLPFAAAATVLATLTASPLASACLLSAAAGCAALGVAPAWAICLEIGGEHAGVVTGTMNTFGNLGGALSPVVVGFCLKRFTSFDLPLFSVAALYLVAALAWFAVDPEKPLVPAGQGAAPQPAGGVLAGAS